MSEQSGSIEFSDLLGGWDLIIYQHNSIGADCFKFFSSPRCLTFGADNCSVCHEASKSFIQIARPAILCGKPFLNKKKFRKSSHFRFSNKIASAASFNVLCFFFFSGCSCKISAQKSPKNGQKLVICHELIAKT